MRIVIIAGLADSLVNFRGDLIAELGGRGAEVYVMAPGIRERGRDVEVKALGAHPYEIPLRRTGLNPVSDLNTLLSIYRRLLEIKPAVVLSYTVKPVVYGLLAAYVARVPGRYALITGLGYAMTSGRERGRGFVRKIVLWLYRIALSRASKVFVQNRDDLLFLRRHNLVRGDIPIIVVNGSGVNLERFQFSPVPEGSPRFLMIGRLLGDKGVREYVRAASIVRQKMPAVRFFLAGWIDDNPSVVSRAELNEWISSGAIEYLGYLEDVRPVIAESTVYVLPSYREGTPRTVLEAMAMGRAVITTDAPGCRETVVDGVNGFLVPVRSVDALVDAMLRFVQNPSLAVEMGKRARILAEQKYDVRLVNASMLREMGIDEGGA